MVLNFDKEQKFHLVWAYSIAIILIIIASLYFANTSIGIDDFSDNVGLPAYTIIPGALVIFSIWAVTRSETIQELPKNSLVFLSVAFICWFIAELTWNLYEHVLEIDPYPSIADLFYISAPIFMIIALWIYLKSTKKKISKKKVALASIISLSILVPSLVLTFEGGIEDEPLENFVALSYPIVDSVLLVLAIITILFLISSKRNFFWLMILSGIIIFLVADIFYLFLVIQDMYVDGHPVDILWVSAYTIWATMMFYIIFESKQLHERKDSEVYEKYGSKKIEKYGVFLGLLLINTTVAILLVGINYFVHPKPQETILQFFSWILIVTVIIFSSIVILLNSRLNNTLQNRTLQLEKMTDELIKSERFSAIGELASRISHDIRNPLSNLQMSIELMKKSPPHTKISDDTINEKLELASKNIERISHQVNDVLGFVQNREMKKENFRLTSCVRDAIESVHIPENIKIKYTKSGIHVKADPFQLQIVFNNLIINAIQAIGKDNGEILIRLTENDNESIIKVENSGPSISEDVLPHIFDSLVTTKQVGTGLGLVSCKTIIENHKGSITVRNDPTVFTVTIPKQQN